MTREQKAWLDGHTEYQPIGQPGGMGRYKSRGALCADGTFKPVVRGLRLEEIIANTPAAFGVGILEVGEPGKDLPDPRTNFGPRTAGR